MSLMSLELKQSVDVLGQRVLTKPDGTTYTMLDIYLEDQGPAILFLKTGKKIGDIVSLRLGVFSSKTGFSHIKLVPVYKDGVVK